MIQRADALMYEEKRAKKNHADLTRLIRARSPSNRVAGPPSFFRADPIDASRLR